MPVEFSDLLLFGAPLVVSSLALGLMHWYPYRNGVQSLARTTAYALGTSVTVGVPAMAMLVAHALGMAQGELFWVALVVANTLVSGATVHLAYWIDSHRAISLDEARHASD